MGESHSARRSGDDLSGRLSGDPECCYTPRGDAYTLGDLNDIAKPDLAARRLNSSGPNTTNACGVRNLRALQRTSCSRGTVCDSMSTGRSQFWTFKMPHFGGHGDQPHRVPRALASLLASGVQLTDEILLINALAGGYRGVVSGPTRPMEVFLRGCSPESF